VNVPRHESKSSTREREARSAAARVFEGGLADGKIPVPRGYAPRGLGAPLGPAANFNKKSGADAPGDSEGEGDPELRRDADRVASVLASSLRKLMGRSQEKCRLWVVAPTVTLVEYVSGKGQTRLVFEGVSTCKSQNCPLCVRKWEKTRQAEIQAAVGNWLRKDLPVIFASLTMRHHRGMPLALSSRILGKAFGGLWSGNKGKKFAAAVGGKPHYVRAHDLTWSLEEWWHPHLHALFFHTAELDLTLDELEELLTERWREALPAALRSMKKLVKRLIGDEKKQLGAGPCRVHKRFAKHVRQRGKLCSSGVALRQRIEDGEPIEEHHQCSDCMLELGLRALETQQKPRKKKGKGYVVVDVCTPEPIELVGVIPEPGDRLLHGEWLEETCSACMFRTGECSHNRDRAVRAFGKELVPDHVPLKDSLIRVRKMLRTFTEDNILPTAERGVVLDRIHKGDPFDQVAGYLPKLGAIGFELASSSTKLGRVDDRGRRHYSKWEVGHLTTIRAEKPLQEAARRAWRQMYKATRGLSGILFSDREALGLGLDPYANGNEPPEIDVDENETTRVVGQVDKPVWCGMARQHGHALIGAVVSAHRAGTLQKMSWLLPPIGESGEPQRKLDPSERAPPDLSVGKDAATAAAARARWRAERDRTQFEADACDRARRWEKLRAASDVQGPEAWAELLASLTSSGQWLGSGVVRGANHWAQVNEVHDRREQARLDQGERGDMVTRALDQLGASNALKGEGLPRRELLLRIELARTLRRTGLDRVTADRMAAEMIN
jgi:hypothetical protein